MELKVTEEELELFLNGHDPQERIVNIEYDYNDDFVRVYYRNENDERCVSLEPFYPFVWARLYACNSLCNGNKKVLKSYMNEYGIWVKKLSITNLQGEECEEMKDGYRYLFYATKPMSQSRFNDFFKKCGFPIYQDKTKVKNITRENDRPFISIPPQEQFLIKTGKRYFKGYDDYNQLLRMTFDLETEGIDPKTCRIKLVGVKLNRPANYKGKKYENFERIFRLEGETEKEKNESELKLIDTFFKVIYTFKPDVITGHNAENFDWNFIIERCTQLGTSIDKMSSKYFKGRSIYKSKKQSILKLGGEVETFYPTIIPGIVATDSLHAVRKTQALDSNFKEANLKYSAKYLEVVKPNRVYVPGNIIDKTLIDLEEHYAFNNDNGDWYIYNPAYVEPIGNVKPKHDLTYFENLIKTTNEKVPNRDEWMGINAGGLTQTWEEYVKEIEDEKYPENITAEVLYKEYLDNLEKDKINKPKKFVLKTHNKIYDGYKLVSGKYIVERYLFDDLQECNDVELTLNQSAFSITKVLPIPFHKCCTMGTATQWKFLMMAWSFERNLAIPYAENTGKFTGGLSRLLVTGFVDEVGKFDYNGLYPSIELTWGIEDEKDISGAGLRFLYNFVTKRNVYKKFKKKAETIIEKYEKQLHDGVVLTEEENKEYHKALTDFANYDNLQKVCKIFCNSNFGSISANVGSVYPWKSLKCGERITCTGRQCLRLMIFYLKNLGYTPIVGDTDGFNFKLLNKSKYRYTEEHPYIGKGLNSEVKKDKKYVRFEADIAEFNDTYMKDFHYAPNAHNMMGLGIDEIVQSTINFSRKNYADYFPEKPYPKDVKLVGNTIKSKKIPIYIEKFLDKGVRLLLQNKGNEFLEEYYNYIEKIYNYQIPLRDIASKGKIKKTVEDYIADCQTVTKSGSKKSRQAWMELVIKNNVKVDLGETVYYINTGSKKSHSDVKRVTHYYLIDENGEKVDSKNQLEREWKKTEEGDKKNKKFMKFDDWVKIKYPSILIEDEIIFYSELLPTEIVESDSDFYCEEGKEYNVEKYIDQFNKRITPLLVCFSKTIRDRILITNPDDRQYFTEEETKLVSGEPNKEGDQDTYEQLMTMEDKEIKFWMAHPEWEIPFLKECNMDWEKIKTDYLERKEKERQMGIDKVRELFDSAIEGLTYDDIDDIQDGKIPSSIEKIAVIDPVTFNFVSKEDNTIVLGTIYDIFDAIKYQSDKKNTAIENSIEIEKENLN